MEYLTYFLFFVGGGAIFSLVRLTFQRGKHVSRPDPRVLALMKKVENMRIELADLQDLYERLMTSHKRLRSSAGMAKLRAMDKEEPADSEFEKLRKLGLVKGPSI